MAKSAKNYESAKADRAADANAAKGKGVPVAKYEGSKADLKADAKGSKLPGAVIGALVKAKRKAK